MLRPFDINTTEDALKKIYSRDSTETGLTFSQLQARTTDFFDALDGKPRPTTPEKKMELGGQFLGCRRITPTPSSIAPILNNSESWTTLEPAFESRWATKTIAVKPKPGLCGNVR